ncbi:hypothetical protein P7F88_02420 [Vibrio hannami]|uniref:hypothetical protein n=1 Tax=Vibrio hannami TaxID=2717094 RepID=UPI00240F0B31|nr:hypothetical protein [Vibrio hannami]MDG3085006.1 hypothetical protein [Vibrio hannami]
MDRTPELIGEVQIAYIGQLLESRNIIDEEAISKLREAFPSLRFTLSSEDEVGEREAYECFSNFDIHLVASHPGGCSHLTYNAEQCNGILIALHEE